MNRPITDWGGRRVWVVGASSGIGAALAVALSARGARVAVSARRREHIDALAAQHAPMIALALDVTDETAWASAHAGLLAAWGGIDLVMFAAGTYAPLRAWEFSAQAARDTVATNLVGVLNGLGVVLPGLLAQGAGGLAIVASVAGYRGLPKALAYGPTKAALINLAEVLHLDLVPRGVSVWLVNPGFVATALTAQNDFRMPALITAQEAAAHIVAGLGRSGFEIHFPKRFTRLLKLLRCLPYRLYFPLVRRATGR